MEKSKRRNCREVLDCASPLALSRRGHRYDSGRGLPHSRTLSFLLGPIVRKIRAVKTQLFVSSFSSVEWTS
jgi:hypothetical protein